MAEFPSAAGVKRDAPDSASGDPPPAKRRAPAVSVPAQRRRPDLFVEASYKIVGDRRPRLSRRHKIFRVAPSCADDFITGTVFPDVTPDGKRAIVEYLQAHHEPQIGTECFVIMGLRTEVIRPVPLSTWSVAEEAEIAREGRAHRIASSASAHIARSLAANGLV
jgi:hypothetical protein